MKKRLKAKKQVKKTRKRTRSKEAELRSFVLKHLRRASLSWEPRNECLREARASRGLFRCTSCLAEVSRKQIRVDHIHPVVPVEGFDSFDGVIRRLLCDKDQLQALCTDCHDIKTASENEVREMYVKNY